LVFAKFRYISVFVINDLTHIFVFFGTQYRHHDGCWVYVMFIFVS